MSETGPRQFRVVTGETEAPDSVSATPDPPQAVYESAFKDLEAWLLADGDIPPYGNPQPTDTTDRIRELRSRDTEEPSPTIAFISRMTNSLRGAVNGLDCAAAALYLLDDATTELTMRAMWGLDPPVLVAEPRPLQGALADLEALCGHAVVLEDKIMHELWSVPEPCAAAVCLPVATPTTILGTLWFFCQTPRKFDESTTHLMEIIAGGLALELALERAQEELRWG